MSQEPTAMAQWQRRHDVFVFYGNGGSFGGATVERWWSELCRSPPSLYVGGAGEAFRFPADVRNRGIEWFKTNDVPFAAVTDSVLLRMLGATSKVIGVNTHVFSWARSIEAFDLVELDPAHRQELDRVLSQLRTEVDAAVAARSRQ